MSGFLWILFLALMVAKYPLLFTGRLRQAAYVVFAQSAFIGFIVLSMHKNAVANGIHPEPIAVYVLLGVIAVAFAFSGRAMLIKADRASQAPKE